MKQKLLAKNTTASVFYQAVSVVCGFILPKYILLYYGSQVNGLLSSITQFIQVINFFDLGITSVIVYNLYKPFAIHDNNRLSEVVSSADSFFRIIGILLCGYILILSIAYPFLINTDFDFKFVAFLILIMGVNAFGQYYLGVVNRLILLADQRNYIPYITQSLTVILNTVVCILLITQGASVHIVKLATSFIYLIRPLIYAICVKCRYSINRHVKVNKNAIDQKWNGIAQHISAVVLDGTDAIVLSIFSSLKNVSIYNIYTLVIIGIKYFVTSLTGGFNSLLGTLWAENKKEEFKNTFCFFEWMMSMVTVVCFGCIGFLIIPFVELYTKNISDTNYYQPIFAVFLTIAYAFYGLRIPYNSVILQIGHYRQTQKSYIISVVINLSVSIICVKMWGLVGVVLGTLLALSYHTLYFQIYVYKRIMNFKMIGIVKLYMVISVCTVFGLVAHIVYTPKGDNLISFAASCVIELIIWTCITIVTNMLFYKDKIKYVIYRVLNKSEETMI